METWAKQSVIIQMNIMFRYIKADKRLLANIVSSKGKTNIRFVIVVSLCIASCSDAM
jgi:hypothetical protein